MAKKEMWKSILMIAIVLIVAKFYNGFQNSKAVDFFLTAKKVIIYDISYEQAKNLSDEELENHQLYVIDNISKEVSSASYEKRQEIDTSENNYGVIYSKRDKKFEAKFINFAPAFKVTTDNKKGIFKYRLRDKNRNSLAEKED